MLMLWRTSVDELGQGFAPAMLDGLLVVATRSGRLTAFDPMSGERRFEHRYRKG
ncbi:MAG: hypothetical protein EBX59_05315, partial [Betaproteobacteria bacterium]|nr:hypothetical protein [Betaproteobacteria bacterium]